MLSCFISHTVPDTWNADERWKGMVAADRIDMDLCIVAEAHQKGHRTDGGRVNQVAFLTSLESSRVESNRPR